MNKKLLLVFIALLFIGFTVKIDTQASISNGKTVTITKDSEDITGDGKVDQIVLTGVKIASEKYKNLVINITDSKKAHAIIHLPDGCNPILQYFDVNHDGIKDIFGSVYDSKSGEKGHQIVYTAKNLKPLNIDLPAPLVLDSHFINGYKANVKVITTGNNYIFDLKQRKTYYEKLGIFYHGKLNEPTELMVHDYTSLKPVQVGEQTGLKGRQKVTGVSESDTIGYVESTWLFDHSKWKLVNVVVLKKYNQ
ncbi:MAG: hypothetical protein Q8935_25790 [Bacillota bacterium]|nr:hypothetical protein [Bacillota bacterium]